MLGPVSFIYGTHLIRLIRDHDLPPDYVQQSIRAHVTRREFLDAADLLKVETFLRVRHPYTEYDSEETSLWITISSANMISNFEIYTFFPADNGTDLPKTATACFADPMKIRSV